jgi:hypothetical protein
MESQIPEHWVEITDLRRLGRSGVFGIVNCRSGRAYIVRCGNISKRVWDHRDLLRRGAHHCRDLQADWVTDSDSFRFVLIAVSPFISVLTVRKQQAIDAVPGTYNQRRAFSRRNWAAIVNRAPLFRRTLPPPI